jgi:hypothetical protein
MSSVFSSPKVVSVQQQTVTPETVDTTEITRDLEKKRKKKNGAVAQMLASQRDGQGKTTLGA